jgi:hypothetical protein
MKTQTLITGSLAALTSLVACLPAGAQQPWNLYAQQSNNSPWGYNACGQQTSNEPWHRHHPCHGNWQNNGNNTSLFDGNNSGVPFIGNNLGPSSSNQLSRLAAKAQQIQQRLATGNLSADQATRLQNRLATIQQEEATLGTTSSTSLLAQQQRIQQLLASGAITPQQASLLQTRLTTLAGQSGLVNPYVLPASNTSGIYNLLRTRLGF